MERRKFLQAIGSTPSGMLASAPAQAAPAAITQPKRPEPTVFFFDDGRHAAALYQFEPPLTPADHTFTVDQLANTGVDSYIYAATLEGGVAQYNSKVMQKWGDNVKEWKHYVWYRAARNLHQLIADGYDPLELIAEACHKGGLWFIPSTCVNLLGGDRAEHGGLGRKSDWVYEHPQFQVGHDSDPRSIRIPQQRFNFLHPEVRQERVRVVEELLSRYQSDGIELNLAEDDFPFPYCRFDQVGQLAPLMTQWLRDIRALAQRAEQAQGRRKRIYVRVPAHPDTWPVIGYQVPVWISEGTVDGLICVTSDGERMDQDLTLQPVVKLAKGTGCRVLASFSSTLYRQVRKYSTPPMIWAAAANAYHQGADGFGLGDAHWTPNGWPWVRDEYQTLRLLGRPDLLATADKLYHVRSDRGETRTQFWLPGGERHLPHQLEPGQSVEIPLRISDDLARWHSLGRLRSAQLRLRFTNFLPSADRVKVELNGRDLPESIVTRTDLTYRLLDIGAVSPYGYILDFALQPEHLPSPGRSTVKVALLARDPMLKLPFELHDVDFEVRYRTHRDFQPEPIEY